MEDHQVILSPYYIKDEVSLIDCIQKTIDYHHKSYVETHLHLIKVEYLPDMYGIMVANNKCEVATEFFVAPKENKDERCPQL